VQERRGGERQIQIKAKQRRREYSRKILEYNITRGSEARRKKKSIVWGYEKVT